MNILDTSSVIRLIVEMLQQNIQTTNFIDQSDITITPTTDFELTKNVREKLYRKIVEQYNVVGTVWRVILVFKNYAFSRHPQLTKNVDGNIIKSLKKYLKERDAKIYSEAINVAESMNGSSFIACDKDFKKTEVIKIGDIHKMDTFYLRPKQEVNVLLLTLK